MLTKKFRLLFLSCFALLLASCSDELPSRGGNVASDSYAGGLKEITLPDGMDDFHYSDFWADPEKQTRPKYWIQHDHETLKGEIYKYTVETISEAGGNIGMVQVGNETNCFFCGETDMYKICDLFTSGAKQSVEKIRQRLGYGLCRRV